MDLKCVRRSAIFRYAGDYADCKGSDMDKILGLEYRADDYISKPFNILEVKARIRAIIRRSMKAKTLKKKNRPILTLVPAT